MYNPFTLVEGTWRINANIRIICLYNKLNADIISFSAVWKIIQYQKQSVGSFMLDNSAPGRTRTFDRPVMSRMLWPTELRALNVQNQKATGVIRHENSRQPSFSSRQISLQELHLQCRSDGRRETKQLSPASFIIMRFLWGCHCKRMETMAEWLRRELNPRHSLERAVSLTS